MTFINPNTTNDSLRSSYRRFVTYEPVPTTIDMV
jgi:hypothetical protein